MAKFKLVAGFDSRGASVLHGPGLLSRCPAADRQFAIHQKDSEFDTGTSPGPKAAATKVRILMY
ncbi:MAG: hypothetical protein ACXU93_05945 [Thermodesulfobacteriota bacterium]